MTSINILHASDLHVSVHKQLRSPLDRLSDLDAPWDVSAGGIADKLRITRNLITAWWQRMAVSSYDPEILESLAEFIYENAKLKLDDDGSEIAEEGEEKLDAVLLTGDLATTGRRDDIERVSKFLRAKFNAKYPHRSDEDDYRGATLSAVKIPVLFLPGNHDRFVPTREMYERVYPKFFTPGGIEFDQLLFDYRRQPLREIELSSKVSEGKNLRVVLLAADFTLEHFDDHEGLYGWLAQGKVYSDIRQRMIARTEQLREQKKDDEILCVLWAVHFPPDYPGNPDHSKLIGDGKLISGANQAGVRAVLAGHTHEQLRYRNPGMSFEVFCCGTTTQHEPQAVTEARDGPDARRGNLFQIITITAGAAGNVAITSKDYRYSSVAEAGGPRLLRWAEVPSPRG
jgi:3',5'-cyclic AMP phosphodiesterase CpdA